MIRWIAVLSTLLALSGCVTTREVVYRDGYSRDAYAERRYYDEDGTYYADEDRRTVYRDGSYYTPGYAGSGDYYSGSSYGYDSYSSYWEYPAYYSVFWPMYRSWYDPYWYPNYYYGVTYYPRNYLSIGFGSGWNRPYYSSWSYSPYRYSWADNYYDWSPWHGYRHSHRDYRGSPRYGSSRNEAEQLARLGGGRYQPSRRAYGGSDGAYGRGNSYGGNGYGGDDGRTTAIDRYGRTRGSTRDADYRSQPDRRQEPTTGVFGIPTRGNPQGDVRRVSSPASREFSVPVDGNARSVRRTADYGALPQRPPAATRGYDSGNDYSRGYAGGTDRRAAPQEVRRYDSQPARSSRGYDAGVAMPREGSRSAPAYERRAAPQDYSRGSAPSIESRSYEAPAMRSEPRSRGYDAGGGSGYAMPAREPSYETRSAPSYESRPEPRQESRSEPRFESRSESRSEDRGGGGVRRVGNRDDRD